MKSVLLGAGVFLLLICEASAQSGSLDDLQKVLNDNPDDTTRLKALAGIATHYRDHSKTDSAIYYSTRVLHLAKPLQSSNNKRISYLGKFEEGNSHNLLGGVYQFAGKIPEALNHAQQALKVFQQLKDEKRISSCYLNLGSIYETNAEYGSALDNMEKSMKIKKQIGDSGGMANVHLSMGNVYADQGDYPAAITEYEKGIFIRKATGNFSAMGEGYYSLGRIYLYQGNSQHAVNSFFSALRSFEEIGHKTGIAHCYNAIATIHRDQGTTEDALDKYEQARKIYAETNDLPNLAHCYNNIAIIYTKQKKYDEAMEMLEKSRLIKENAGDRAGLIDAYNNIGNIHFYRNENKSALQNYMKAKDLAEIIGEKDRLGNAYACIGMIYTLDGDPERGTEWLNKAIAIHQETGNPWGLKSDYRLLVSADSTRKDFKSAFEHFKIFLEHRATVLNEASSRKTMQQQMQYDFDKKEALAKLEQERKEAVHASALREQTMQRNGFVGGFVLMLSLAGVSYRSYRNKRKANLIISGQKQQVELQKQLVEAKNKEILDSINYARRLQEAIMPPAKMVREFLDESFILYKPKDIVAGDFYWMETNHETVYFAAADCTGHGVPGAMVSMVCANALTRTVREFGVKEPALILNKVRELVISTFEKSEDQVRDGMDISLVALHFQDGTINRVEFSGANNPLWIIRNGSDTVEEVKGDKQPVGVYSGAVPFTNHNIDLFPGDLLYVFSDGFQDQFGGDKGKKFKSANFKKLLLSVRNEPMEKQRELVADAFESWRGSLEQVDDLCVVGLKV